MAFRSLDSFSGEGDAFAEELRSTVDGVLAILNDPTLKSRAVKVERRSQLRRLIYPKFDFIEMAKQSLGIHWRRRTFDEQQQFVHVFTDFLERSYANKIESYNGEKIIYAQNIQEQEYGEVDTKVLTATGDEIPVSYKLHLVDGAWKIYDLVIGTISLVNDYRCEFHRMIATASYEELIRKMRETPESMGS